ncbi:MAG: ModD protein [Campylobacter sp.]|nr:ModD protein [Campylobacter sp.]
MISDTQIWEYIRSDIPFDDITASLQSAHLKRPALLEIITREDIILSNVDVASRIATLLGCETISGWENSQNFNAGNVIFQARGSYGNLHKAWKLIQILLEYSCKISTYTKNMVSVAQAVNPNCQIQTTRKTFPFAKEFCVSAVLSGGGAIHRLNLSDSVLLFKNHINVYENFEEFCKEIKNFKAKLPEKKIMVECETLENFKTLLNFNPDVIQCDKMSLNELKHAVKLKNKSEFKPIITAAGGINLKNCAQFAATGVNALVTSAPYAQGTADLTARLTLS